MVTLDDLERIFSAEKVVSSIPAEWVESRRVTNINLSLLLPNRVGEVTLEGVNLRGGCVKEFSDKNVVFQLEYSTPKGPTLPIIRYEWRPIRGHTNKGIGPDPSLHWTHVAGTHLHPFHLNATLGLEAMRAGNLPIAVAEPDPPTFHALLARMSDIMRITNAGEIPEPQWQPRLAV
jgi:hypothetical protein